MSQIIHLLRLRCSILEQLKIEEALLRADDRNWCIINQGSFPSIVMGISGKVESLINDRLMQKKPIPIIRRFSGGGTVYIDENTYFVTLIFNSESIDIPCCPDKIFHWTEQLYSPIFFDCEFKLVERDYVSRDKKFGGNAQYLCKKRWLHHSSLLWDFDEEKMNYLLMPIKMPSYRKQRKHQDFLCSLKTYIPSIDHLEKRIINRLNQEYQIYEEDLSTITPIIQKPHRRVTTLI